MLRGRHRSLGVSEFDIRGDCICVDLLREAPVMMASLPSKTLGEDMIDLDVVDVPKL